MLGVDRLHDTKGIDRKPKAIAELFADSTLSASPHRMVQIARQAARRILTGKNANTSNNSSARSTAQHSSVGHPAFHYLHQSTLDEPVALYLAADEMLLTPLRDGMNLVAKYVGCRVDATGSLVLSEFAGARPTNSIGANLVNPHELDGLKHATCSRAAKRWGALLEGWAGFADPRKGLAAASMARQAQWIRAKAEEDPT